MGEITTGKAEQTTIHLRRRIPMEQLTQFQGEALELLWRGVEQSPGRQVGHVYVRYWDVSDAEADVEIGVPVEGVAPTEPLAEGSLPGGSHATHRHLGEHATLKDAYRTLNETAANRAVAGPAWEVYEWIPLHTAPDPASWPAADAWSTLLVQPLEPTTGE
ncbi:GyrI-like domain-containing protein [Nocardiopsis sp. NPDC049922]|uniref:GyrI-like domain-containing protein n=1 Tax=Nocardiopsis sp. NPDC049922 TaxID=3155157 RepID=UPI0034013BC9